MNRVTVQDQSLVEAIKDIIEPDATMPKAHTGARVEWMRRQHLARSKAARILTLVREVDGE